MSNPLDKFKQIFHVAEPFAKPFVPGGVGSILDKVNEGLSQGGASQASSDAIKNLAAHDDGQDQAILGLFERLKATEATIQKLQTQIAQMTGGK